MRFARIAALSGAVVALALTSSAALAQRTGGGYTDHKDPPAGLTGIEHIAPALEAYNSNDPDTIIAFLRSAFSEEFFEGHSAEEHASIWRSAFASNGPLEYEAVRTHETPRDDLVVILWSPVLESWRAMVLIPSEDGAFGGMYFSRARPPSYIEPREPMDPRAAAAKLNDLIDRLAERDMFSGTVKITLGAEVLLEKAVGLASRRFDVPNAQDTKFNLGSMNKMFTAVSIAQLAEAGKLTLDDVVGDHLPDYPNQEVRERVQIKHLLSHTGGTGNHFTEDFVSGSKASYRETADYVELFEDQELRFSPGTSWAYSNAGFYILGLIVEAASGQSYYDYVREHIYARCSMTNSDSFDMDIPIKNLAIGYTRSPMGGRPDDGERWLEEASGLRNNYFMHSIKGGPAGGGFSTTPDLIRFAHALTGGQLVSHEMFETLTTPKPELASPGYGYGFSAEDLGALGRKTGHGGGFPGINGMLDLYVDQGLSVAVLANLDGGAGLVASRYQEMLTRGH